MDPFCVNHLNTMFQKYLKLPFVKGFFSPWFLLCHLWYFSNDKHFPMNWKKVENWRNVKSEDSLLKECVQITIFESLDFYKNCLKIVRQKSLSENELAIFLLFPHFLLFLVPLSIKMSPSLLLFPIFQFDIIYLYLGKGHVSKDVPHPPCNHQGTTLKE